MTHFLAGAALCILLTFLVSIIRVLRGPTAINRMLGVQAFGTAGTAVLAILAASADTPALFDAALVLALLAIVSLITFTQAYRIRIARDREATP